MSRPTTLNEIVRKLDRRRESPHFVVRYAERNPRSGPGNGSHGIRGDRLISLYLDALEKAYRMLTDRFGRGPPRVGKEGKTLVLVLDVSQFVNGLYPFTFDDRTFGPVVGLLSHTHEPTTDGELQRACLDAVHEVGHVFNFTDRPARDAYSKNWIWIDEASAVLLERLVFPENVDVCRYGKIWCDSPELPLDSGRGHYEAAQFLWYLYRSFGPGLLGQVWRDARDYPRERPLETVRRLLLAHGETLLSPNKPDVFGSGYCVASYFLLDKKSTMFAEQLFERHGDRAVTRSEIIMPGKAPVEIFGSLDHLACNYYRFSPGPRATKLFLTVAAEPRDGRQPPLKATVVRVEERLRQKGEPVTLDVQGPRTTPVFHDFEASKLDHAVLVVANCGDRAYTGRPDVPHDDDYPFKVSARAE